MATFSRNAWVTGETITADKLNDPRYGSVNVLRVTYEDDYDETADDYVVDETIETGLNYYDFYNMLYVQPASFEPGGDPNKFVATPAAFVRQNDLQEGGYYINIVFQELWEDQGSTQIKEYSIYYIPETGKLTTTDPYNG